MKNRDLTYDTLKYFAILFVILCHFADIFDPSLFRYYDLFPYSLIIKGLTGKCGVAIFGVISGLFSYRAGGKENLVKYIAKRYAYYVICGFFANTLYYLFNMNNVMNESSFGLVIGQSLFIDKLIFETFWFARSFFIGSIISYVFGKYKISGPESFLFSLIFFYLGELWIAVFLVGCLTQNMLDRNFSILKKPIVKIVLAVFVFVMIRGGRTAR